MLPSDPNILLSYINTKLRDEFPSLDELCDSLDADKDEIITTLKAAGYRYDPVINHPIDSNNTLSNLSWIFVAFRLL